LALLRLLSEADVEYAILGGLAVSIYGEPRFTADIDVGIILEKDRIDNFLRLAKEHNFYPIPGDIKRFIGKTGVIPMKFRKGKVLGRCDFIIAENIIERSALKRAKSKNIGPIKARFVTPEDLIIHKITAGRPQDIEDVRSILARRNRKLDIKYIQYWLGLIDKSGKQTGFLKAFRHFLKS
jgi:hypothetical protein